MRAAPAVLVVAADGSGWRAARRSLYALTAMAAAAWSARRLGGTAGPAAAAAAAAGLITAVLHARCAPAAPPRRLRWDGAQWALAAAEGEFAAGSIRPALDLGIWLLLRFDPAAGGAAQWLPVDRALQPAAWPALRAAVFAGPAAGGDTPSAP